MKQDNAPLKAPSEMTTDELMQALHAYDFRDPIGHPLRNCMEFIELCQRAAGMSWHISDAERKRKLVAPTHQEVNHG